MSNVVHTTLAVAHRVTSAIVPNRRVIYIYIYIYTDLENCMVRACMLSLRALEVLYIN